jgi:hypothetical protein
MLMRPAEPATGTCSNCIFDQPWWLDAVAPGGWDAVEVCRGGQTVGRWPFVRQKRCGLTILTMPPYTQVLGPWIAPIDAKYERQLSREKEILTELLGLLPPFHYFSQCFHGSISNWLPLYWRKWKQTTRYTYVIHHPIEEQALWQELSPATRRDIRRAEDVLEVEDGLHADDVVHLQQQSYRRQRTKTAPSADIFRRIGDACQTRQAGMGLIAKDNQGRPHAGIYVVWDSQRMYYLAGGGDPQLRNSGANSLLVWRAIQLAAQRGLSFDFEGSMVEPIERFFRSFGARQVPYSKVTKANGRLTTAAVALREILEY